MPQIQTTLTGYDKREGNGDRGPWTLHLYKDAAGTSYQTFKNPISNQVFGLGFESDGNGGWYSLNTPVVLTYEDTPSKKTDAQGNPYPPNREIKGVGLDTTAQDVSAAPVASQSAFVEAALNPTGTFRNSGGDAKEINIQRQSAILRVPPAVAEGLLDGSRGLYVLAEELLHFYQTGEYPGKSEGEFLAAVGNEFPDAA